MTGRLAEKVALITGTSPNLCGGIAEGMAEEGAKIVCVDIPMRYGRRSALSVESVWSTALLLGR